VPAPAVTVLARRRVLEHSAIFPQIADRPILGSGLGATYRIPGAAVLGGPKSEIVDHHYVHDLYLLIAFRLGVPGLVLFLLLLATYFRSATRNLRNSRYSLENAGLMAGLISAMVGEAVLSLTSPTILAHPTAGVIGLTMAITATTLVPDSVDASSVGPSRTSHGFTMRPWPVGRLRIEKPDSTARASKACFWAW
jgi:O-antigen ligase